MKMKSTMELKLQEECDYWRKLFIRTKKEKEAVESQKLEIKISKLDFKPGDVISISAPGAISYHTAQRLKAYFEKCLPGVKALVFADGLKIEIQSDV